MKRWMQHKVVRFTMWVLLALTGLTLALMIAVQSYISIHRSDLLAGINEQLGKRLPGKATIQGLGVNVWRHFPNAEIILNHVVYTDTVYHRPLLEVATVSTRIGLTEILGKHPAIHMVKLANGRFHLFTDSTGYSNQYLLRLQPQPAADSNQKKITINEVVLENIGAVAEDAVKNKRFAVVFEKATAYIHQHDSLVKLDVREDIRVEGLGFNLAKGSYLENKRISGRWKLLYNTASHTLSFPETPVKIDRHPLVLQGAFSFNSNGGSFALKVHAKKIGYQDAALLLPERLQQKLMLVNLERPLDVDATIAGGLARGSESLVQVHWTTRDNRLVTPVALLDSCSFSGSFTNELVPGQPRVNENSQIVINDFTGKWGAAVFKGSTTTLTNLAMPELAFDLYSDCSFPALNNQFGLKSLRFLEGRAQIALHYKGPLVKDASFLHNVSGKLAVQNGAVHYEARDLLFTDCNGEVAFAADSLSIQQLQCRLGNNRFTVRVSGKNMASLTQSDMHKAVLSCAVYTPSLDLADFRHLFKGQKHAPAPQKGGMQKTVRSMFSFDEILEKGSLELNIQADAIQLNHFTATGLSGEVAFRRDEWQLQKVTLQHAGGSMLLKGNIKHPGNGSRHEADVSIILKEVDVRKVFYAFDNFGQKGISYANLQGKLNTNARLQLALNDRGDIVPNSMNGKVWFSLRDGALVNYEPVQRIQKFVFKDRDMRNITFGALQDSLIIVNDEIEIRRMEIRSSVMTLYLEGIYSLKDNTDISIQVPLHNFLARGADKEPQNRGVDARTGPSIYLRAKSDIKGNIKLGLDLFKKFRKKHKGKDAE